MFSLKSWVRQLQASRQPNRMPIRRTVNRLDKLALMSLEDRAIPAVIGYYDMLAGAGVTSQVAPISTAGQTAVQLSSLTPSELAAVDVIFVQNPDNGGYGGEYTSHLADIQAAVQAGKVLVIHDRFVDSAESILPGGANFSIVRDFQDDSNIDVLDPGSIIANGPGGTVTNSTLDGGTSSSHGFALQGTLPGSAHLLLSNSTPSHIVTFSYGFGLGSVVYSSIPLDFYLAQPTILPNFSQIYAPNAVAYAVSLANKPPVAAAGPDRTTTEGASVSFTGSGSSDPDGDSLTYSWNFGDGGTATGVNASHTYQDNGVYTVTLTVSDGKGGTATDTAKVTVNNVAPTMTALSVTPEINENGVATLTGTFSDPGQDSHTVTVNWGPGETPTTYAVPVGQRNFTLTHQYLDDNPTGTPTDTYVLTVTVADDDGGSSGPGGGTGSGAVIIDGGDRDEHGFFSNGQNQAGWKYIEQMVNFANQGHRNGGSGILVVGASDNALNAINSAAGVLGLTTTRVTGSALNTVNFNQYAVVYVPSSAGQTFGGVSDSDLATLTARKQDVQNYINSGGSLVALTEFPSAQPFGWLELPQAFTISSSVATDVQYRTQALVNSGLTITDAELSAGTPVHNVFTGPVGFNGLVPFVYNVGANGIRENGGGDDQVLTLGLAPGSVGVGLSVTVHNVAPTAAIAGAPASSPEGTAITLGGTVTDPSSADTFTYAWSVTKNGSAYAAGTGSSLTFTPNDNGTYVVALTVTDDDGGVGSDSETVTVTNVNPAPAITGAPASSPEGTAISLGGSASDPGSADTLTYAWTVTKDGNAYSSGTGASFAFTPDDNGSYAVTLTVTDDDGGTGTSSETITVTNVAPQAVAITGAPASSPEGTAISLGSSFSDPGSADTHTYLWQVSASNGQVIADGTGSNFSFTPNDNGNYVVTLTVTDDDGGAGSDSKSITVTNVNPTPSITGAPSSSPEGTAITLGSSVSDPGSADTFTYAWSVTKDGIAYASGTGASFAFTPDDNGTYAVTLTVTDDDSGTGITSQTITVTNVAPTAAITGAPASGPEGTAISLGSTVSDPGSADTFAYAWSVTKDGVAYASGSGSSFTFTPDDNASYVVTLTVTDDDGGADTRTATITATNVAPTPTIDSISAVRLEGTAISVAGSATDPAGANDTLTFAWAVYKDGSATAFDTGSGPNWSFTPTDNGSYKVVLTVSDEDGGSTSVDQTITVDNVAPQNVAISGPSSGVRGQLFSFAGSATDPAGTNDPLTYAWAVYKDGSATAYATGSGTGFSFTPVDTGSYEVRLTVSDDDGGSTTATHAVAVKVVDFQNGDLSVGGTSGDDHIIFTPGSQAGEVVVKLNGVSLGTFTPTGRLVAYGQAGDDDIQVAGSLTLPAWLYGGDGDDRMKGGAGSDVLLGETGEDLLIGGDGRDLLIGGVGADRIIGNADDDVLIAGSTKYDTDPAALSALMAEWTRTDLDAAHRIAHLDGTTAGGLNGAYTLTASGTGATLLDDGAADVLTGGAGTDWFITDGEVKDNVTDWSRYEQSYSEDVTFMNAEVG